MSNEPDDKRIPVTVLTGFLGSGKTTLLNHILTATHGKKIAIIENEFGEIAIDDALLKANTKTQISEEIIEVMNGCICCTVRQDLVVVLKKLAARVKRGTLKLDAIVIETTGLADPAPVAQTFFVDDDVAKFARLDGIVTLVDAKHIEQHLDAPKPEVSLLCQIGLQARAVLSSSSIRQLDPRDPLPPRTPPIPHSLSINHPKSILTPPTRPTPSRPRLHPHHTHLSPCLR